MEAPTTTLKAKLTGSDLRLVRSARGLSQGAVAQRAGISQVMLSLIERGAYQMTPAVELALIRTLWGRETP